MTNLPDVTDPFNRKKEVRLERLKKMYEDFQANSVNHTGIVMETWLLELILRSNFKLSINQIKAVIGIDSSNEAQMQVFNSLHAVVTHLAKSLYESVGCKDLLEYPLTDIIELLYTVARSYQPLFFVPVREEFILTVHETVIGDTEDNIHGINPVQQMTPTEIGMLDLIDTIPSPPPINDEDQNQNQNQISHRPGITKEMPLEIVKLHDRFHQMWILLVFMTVELDQL